MSAVTAAHAPAPAVSSRSRVVGALVRAEARQQELAIHAALGAGTARIARALLAESMTLGLLGGGVGLALAYAGVRLLVANAPDGLPRVAELFEALPEGSHVVTAEFWRTASETRADARSLTWQFRVA